MRSHWLKVALSLSLFLAPLACKKVSTDDIGGGQICTAPGGCDTTDTDENPVDKIPTTNSPSAPGILTPENGALKVSKQLTLKWAASTDADAGDSLTYQVYLGTSADNLQDISVPNLQATEWTVPFTLRSNTQYFWKVKVTDSQGHVVESSATPASFRTKKSFVSSRAFGVLMGMN